MSSAYWKCIKRPNTLVPPQINCIALIFHKHPRRWEKAFISALFPLGCINKVIENKRCGGPAARRWAPLDGQLGTGREDLSTPRRTDKTCVRKGSRFIIYPIASNILFPPRGSHLIRLTPWCLVQTAQTLQTPGLFSRWIIMASECTICTFPRLLYKYGECGPIWHVIFHCDRLFIG
jgi:hypothetical protein